MMHPSRIDGEPLRVVTMPDGRVFVDACEETKPPRGKGILGTGSVILSRGGPEYSRHFHRFDDYGLTDGLLRCDKCGLVAEAGTENFDSGKGAACS